MAPDITETIIVTDQLSTCKQRTNFQTDEKLNNINNNSTKSTKFKAELRWPDFFVQTFLHIGFVYGIYLLFYVKLFTLLWCKYNLLIR